MNITYAQRHEDVVLDRLLAGIDKGFYVDVGANDPVALSVTKRFYDRGWQGVNIEPLPSLQARLQAERQRDINLNVGLARQAGLRILYETPAQLAFSTFSPQQAEIYRRQGQQVVERQVPMRTLAQVCAEYVGTRTIDFLAVDVEGLEREVLDGADWSRWRPRVLLIEATQPCTAIPTHQDWESVILTVGYLPAWFDGQNRFYVREEDRDRLIGFRGIVQRDDPDAPEAYHATCIRSITELEQKEAVIQSLRVAAQERLELIHKLTAQLRGTKAIPNLLRRGLARLFRRSAA